jgi:hypothetical protein
MAKTVLTDAFVSIGGNDISDHVRTVTLNYAAEEQDDTTMGDDTRTNLGGLKTWSLDLEVANDFAATEIDSIMFPLVGTQVAVVFRPTSAAKGTNNPEYTGTGMLSSYNPVGQSVGDLATAPITIVSAGTLARAVA